MSTSRQHHRFQASGPRVWSSGWLVLFAGAIVVALTMLVVWSGSDQRSIIHAELTKARAATSSMTVYKSPACECCGKWVAQLRQEGFTVKVVEQEDIAPVKTRLGVPAAAISCHTSAIGGYVIEGHVPSADIVRLLAERPAVVGIAVPGMPTGAPGMDGPKVPYTVVSFDRSGTLTTFSER